MTPLTIYEGTYILPPTIPMISSELPGRSKTLQMSKSFTRLDPSRSSPLARSRASTLQGEHIPENVVSDITTSPLYMNGKVKQDDFFEKSNLVNGSQGLVNDVGEIEVPHHVPDGFDELPVELISLTDRYVIQLCSKVTTNWECTSDLLNLSVPKYTIHPRR